ncbi:MAG: tetratricopeptide repeat protein [Alphaproteobacteria bacterium]|nr:tetratricopeptide repeat protein [Alphaproteobacteria bacterium]
MQIVRSSLRFRRHRPFVMMFGVVFAIALFATTVQANHPTRGFRATGVATIDAATTAYHNGDLHRALEGYTRAINSGGLSRLNLAIAHFDRAVVLSDLGEHELAIENYDQAISLKPDEPDFYNNRGNSYHLLGEDRTAILDYDEAVRLNPDFAFAYHNRGSALADLGASAEAVDNFNYALALDPEMAVAYWGRARVFRIVGEFEQALSDYRIANGLNPDLDATLNRGYVYFLLGEFTAAENEFAAKCVFDCDLWEALGRYAARVRLGDDAAEQLATDTGVLDLGRWPGPVVEYLLGRLNENRLLAAARNFNSQRQREQLVMATFFIGQNELLNGDPDRAADFFERTLDQDLPTWIQSTAAREELIRLGRTP